MRISLQLKRSSQCGGSVANNSSSWWPLVVVGGGAGGVRVWMDVWRENE